MTLFAQAAGLDLASLLNTQSLLAAVVGFGLAMLKARFPNLPLPNPSPAPTPVQPVPTPVPTPEPAGVIVAKLSDAAVEQIRGVLKESKA